MPFLRASPPSAIASVAAATTTTTTATTTTTTLATTAAAIALLLFLLVTKKSRSGLTGPLSGHSVGTYQKMSSYATCQGTFGHSRLSSLRHCGLILA